MSNPQSEVFFMRIHNAIEDQILILKKIKIIEESAHVEKLERFEEYGDSIWNILRLFQLFAEGHYSELQNYVRYQARNYHSYDLINDFISLLITYFQNKKEEYISIMMQLFETLTEFIQGPCHENQQALI